MRTSNAGIFPLIYFGGLGAWMQAPCLTAVVAGCMQADYRLGINLTPTTSPKGAQPPKRRATHYNVQFLQDCMWFIVWTHGGASPKKGKDPGMQHAKATLKANRGKEKQIYEVYKYSRPPHPKS